MANDNKLSFKKTPTNVKVTQKNNNTFGNSYFGIIFLLFVLAFGLLLLLNKYSPETLVNNKPIVNLPINKEQQVVAFSSVDDFKNYLVKTSDLSYYGAGSAGMMAPPMMNNQIEGDFGTKELSNISTYSMGPRDRLAVPERVSETNVQVTGVDEPDILKTDGQNIFFSPDPIYGIYRGVSPLMMEDSKMMPPDYQPAMLQIIKALPATEAAKIASIEKTGNLLLKNNILVVFAGQEIFAYDVADPTKPEKKWSYNLTDDFYLQTARLLDDQIYILTQNYINEYKPCPFMPLQADGKNIEIGCTEIYHPITPVAVDVNFSALKLDLVSGEVKDKVSFLGNSGQSILYMSLDNLFVSYNESVDEFAFLYKFITEKANDLFPEQILLQLSKINSYELSQSSKMNEFSTIMEKWMESLSDDDSLKLENELENRMNSYIKEHQRELLSTGIVKISLANFAIDATGKIPGTLLNQFSLDEFDGNLRIATTIGDSWSDVGSTNDVYVLDKKLNVIGSILDLGLGERVYSARFIKDKAYLVTFKQTDPFYVLDLADPKNPQKKGELKIPGFSSYLHPLADNKILGVGREDSKVKLSYFDVSDPANPQEIAKYLLDEYWTEVSDNHHAFLQDAKHQLFFIPGGQGAYIFSYQDNNLALVKAIDIDNVKRALYINDNMYILANNKIRIFNEETWEQVKELSLD